VSSSPTTRKQAIARPTRGFLDPGGDGISRLFRQFELNGSFCLFLDDDCSRPDPPSKGYAVDAQCDEIAASQFAVDGQIEHREVAHLVHDLKADPDRPDFLQFKRRLLTDEPPLVPRLFRMGLGYAARRGCNRGHVDDS
jgi:hypothetical protein